MELKPWREMTRARASKDRGPCQICDELIKKNDDYLYTSGSVKRRAHVRCGLAKEHPQIPVESKADIVDSRRQTQLRTDEVRSELATLKAWSERFSRKLDQIDQRLIQLEMEHGRIA